MRALWTQARADAPGLVLLAVVVAVTCLLASVVPRQVAHTEQAALLAAADAAPVSLRELRGQFQGGAGSAGIAQTGAAITATLPPLLAARAGEQITTSTTEPLPAAPADGSPGRRPQTKLLVRAQPALDDVATWTDGRAPVGVVDPVTTASGRLAQVEVGVAAPVAEHLGLSVGDLLVVTASPDPSLLDRLPGQDVDLALPQVAVLVTGLFSPAPGTPPATWEGAGPVLQAYPEYSPSGDLVAEQAVAVTAASAVDDLVVLGRLATLWRIPIDLHDLPTAQVPALEEAIQDAVRATVPVPRSAEPGLGGSSRVRLVTGLPTLLAGFRADVATARTLAAVTFLGLGAIAAAALVMAASQLQGRRARATVLARARGFSLAQTLTATLPPAVLVVVPAAAAGLYAGAALVPGPAGRLPVTLTVGVAVVTLAAVALATVAGYRRGESGPTPPTRPAWRWTVEAAVVLVAVLGVVLLQRRGLAAADDGAAVDPFLALVPVLLALAAAVIALRLHPLPTALAVRAARGGRGAPVFLGLTAARGTPGWAGSAALAVLVVAVTFGVFASTVASTVGAGQQEASWADAGADLTVVGTGIEQGLVDGIGTADGVRAVVPAVRDEEAVLSAGSSGGQPVVVLALDPVAYAAARTAAGGGAVRGTGDLADLAAAPDEVGVVPALAAEGSPLATSRGTLTIAGGEVGVHVIATSAAVPAASRTGALVLLVPVDALAQVRSDAVPQNPDELLVLTADDGAARRLAETLADDPTRLGATGLTRLRTQERADAVAELAAAPLVQGTRDVLALGLLAAGGYGLLAVVLSLRAGAPARSRSLSVLRTLGMPPRSARLLLAVELVPLVVVALAVGLVLGLRLLPVTADALDLRPYTGGSVTPSFTVDPAQVALLAGAAVVVVGAAAITSVVLDRRRRLGAALRLGGTP